MIPYQILENVIANESENKEVVRLAYEIAYEGRLKKPNERSTEFVLKRMDDLKKIFRSHE